MVGQAHTLDATAAARVAALRSSLFAATTPLSREPAFAGAGRCFKRGRRQHADGRLVSTRSCWCALARVATAAARAASRALPLHSGGAAAGVARHNPIPVRPPVGWRDAAMPCHSGGSARGVWSTGLSGRLPKFPSRSIWGLCSNRVLRITLTSSTCRAEAEFGTAPRGREARGAPSETARPVTRRPCYCERGG